MKFDEQLRLIRMYMGLSQIELAEKLSVSYTTVNRWENGRTMPRPWGIERIQQFCKDNGHEIVFSIEE